MCGWLSAASTPRLALQPRATGRDRAQRTRRQDLDGDVASELRVARAIDLAHAAGADGLLHVIHARVLPVSDASLIFGESIVNRHGSPFYASAIANPPSRLGHRVATL